MTADSLCAVVCCRCQDFQIQSEIDIDPRLEHHGHVPSAGQLHQLLQIPLAMVVQRVLVLLSLVELR